jgi:hypothetical protein
MKEMYKVPVLTEFGRIDQVTLGSSGAKFDVIIDFSTGTPVISIDGDNPTCDNNVGSGYCYTVTGLP